MADFIKADIGKLESFVTQSEEAITEFADIREEFDRINFTLMANWEGAGKTAFQQVALHITENIENISDVLNTINDEVVNDLIEQYKQIDNDLGQYNITAGDPEEGE